MRKAIRAVGLLVSLCVTVPIWYFLIYEVLIAVHADRLMWFLYWIYFPAGVFAALVEKISKVAEED